MERHQLTDIRDAAVALLSRRFKVSKTKYWQFNRSTLPCVVVYIENRQSARFNDSPLEYRHEASLITQVCVQASEDAEDVAEAMLAEVERLFYANPTLQHGPAEGRIDELADDLDPIALDVFEAGDHELVFAAYKQSWRAVWFERAGQYVGHPDYLPQTEIGGVIGEDVALRTSWQLTNSEQEVDAVDQIPKGA